MIFIVCCILHNILTLNDELDEFDVFDEDVADDIDNDNDSKGDHDGEKKRKLLAKYLRTIWISFYVEVRWGKSL